MTNEEAIKELKDASDREFKYGDTRYHHDEVMNRIDAFEFAIKALEQESKTGHWIKMGEGFTPYECSECEAVEFKKSKYCPNCGAKMESEE